MFPEKGGRITWAVLAVALGLGAAGSALAEPTTVTQIKGKKLHLFSESGKRVGSLDAGKVNTPLDILDVSAKGKFLVEIPGQGRVWILKAQTKTDEGAPEVVVSCDQITQSFASSRGLGDCK